MKRKTSITLSGDVLEAIDHYDQDFRSRSEFLEMAAREYLTSLALKKSEERDLHIINKNADALNKEAEDVLGWQVPL